MNERRLNDSSISPVKQLENFYNSLADDVFDAQTNINEVTNHRASKIARAAIDEALSGKRSDSIPKTQEPSDRKTKLPSPLPETNIRSKLE
jgi:hypothetical protein